MEKEAVLAEYASIRSEIQQLNGQMFTVLSSSIAGNVAILGWFFSKENLSDFYALPTVGILLLFWANIIFLNRNRLAHRLALFQKHFIESCISDIRWGHVYFEYRKTYPKGSFTSCLTERLAEPGAYMIFTTSFVNIIILTWVEGKTLFIPDPKVTDWGLVANFIVAFVFFISQPSIIRIMTNYNTIEDTMCRLSETKCTEQVP